MFWAPFPPPKKNKTHFRVWHAKLCPSPRSRTFFNLFYLAPNVNQLKVLGRDLDMVSVATHVFSCQHTPVCVDLLCLVPSLVNSCVSSVYSLALISLTIQALKVTGFGVKQRDCASHCQ